MSGIVLDHVRKVFSGDVVANGIKIHYYRTGGDKPPVVLSHGATDDGLCWTRVTLALEAEYDVIMPDARGHGYATEAGRALVGLAAETFRGEILAMIDPKNEPSQNVAAKLGFVYWKQAVVNGYLDNLYRLELP